jgi:GGDEF domain-containing protein
MGQRLSGWVAANRQTILNSDPMLDLGEIARILKPALRSCLSTPMLRNGHLVGVLTVYSTHREAFTEDHQRIVEVVARQVSQTFERAMSYRREHEAQLKDTFTGLPNRQHLERFLLAEVSTETGLPCSIVVVETRGRHKGGPSLASADVATAMRPALRGADLLFVYDECRMVALLTQTDAETAEAAARRIAAEVVSAQQSEEDLSLSRVGWATAPGDGVNLHDMVRVAEGRMPPTSSTHRPSVH